MRVPPASCVALLLLACVRAGSVMPARTAPVSATGAAARGSPNGDEVEWTAIVFECETVGGVLAPQDGEALELRYFAAEEAPTLQLPYPRTLFDRRSTSSGMPATLFI